LFLLLLLHPVKKKISPWQVLIVKAILLFGAPPLDAPQMVNLFAGVMAKRTEVPVKRNVQGLLLLQMAVVRPVRFLLP